MYGRTAAKLLIHESSRPEECLLFEIYLETNLLQWEIIMGQLLQSLLVITNLVASGISIFSEVVNFFQMMTS